MVSDLSFRCYRCSGQTRPAVPAADKQEIGTITLSFSCPRCRQRYELQYVLSAIFATAEDGEAQALLHRCERCRRLYLPQDNEPHVCDDERSVDGTVPREEP